MTLSPSQASSDTFDRADAVIAFAAGERGAPKDDLLRLSLVLTVSGLDTYVHHRVMRNASSHRWSLPPELAKLSIDFSVLAELSNAAAGDRRIRPWVRAKNAMQRELLTKTFHSVKGLESGMNMAGVTSVWKRSSAALGTGETAGQVKAHLGRIVVRRNQIVHEGDLQRQSRPRHIRHNPIGHAYVSNELVWMRAFVAALDSLS